MLERYHVAAGAGAHPRARVAGHPGRLPPWFPSAAAGVSTGARASLNLGKRWGDDPAAVDANRDRLAAFAGYPPDQLQMMRHVHGTNVWRVGEPVPELAEFDGLVCDRAGPILGAAHARLVFRLLSLSLDAHVCGSAHAGWRGTVAGIAERVVARLGELGGRPERVRVALGPSIGPCCFEVVLEVVAAFHRFGDIAALVVDRAVAEPGSISSIPGRADGGARVGRRAAGACRRLAAVHAVQPGEVLLVSPRRSGRRGAHGVHGLRPSPSR